MGRGRSIKDTVSPPRHSPRRRSEDSATRVIVSLKHQSPDVSIPIAMDHTFCVPSRTHFIII